MSRKANQSTEVVYRDGNDLAILLRSLIDESGLSRYAVAKAAGLTQSTLSRMYTGSRPATMETLKALAESLDRVIVVRVE